MKRFTLMTMVAMLMLALAAPAMAAPVSCSKAKVASFDFLVDTSGSMMMKHKALKKVKIELAKAILLRVNERIPELGYTGSIHTFAPELEVVKQQTYNRSVFQAGFSSFKDQFEVFNRLTPMGDGLKYWSDRLYSTLPGPTAVIIISDGENNRGLDPLNAAQEALAANRKLCFHVISLADTPMGQQVLDSITALTPGCSVSVKAADMLASDAVVDKFVQDVFCAGGKIVLRSVQFAFDSAELTAESRAILDEVASMVKQQGRPIAVDGHTCSIGTDEYNQRLSERRAASVKKYLASKGVPADGIVTHGYGESRPKFDNATEEGRRLNRRAEIDFK